MTRHTTKGIFFAVLLLLAVGFVSANSLSTSINDQLFINAVCNGANATAEITIYSGTSQIPDNLVVPRQAMDALDATNFQYVATFATKGTYTAWEYCDYAGGFETVQTTDIEVTDPQNLIGVSTKAGYDFGANLFYDVFFKADPTQPNTVLFSVGNSSVTMQPLDFGLAQVGKDGMSNGKSILVSTVKATGKQVIKDKNTKKLVYIDPANASGAPIGNTFSYQSIYGNGLDLQYLVNTKYVKEEVVVNDFSSLPAPDKALSKHLDQTDVQLNAFLNISGNSLLVNGQKWDMKKPVMTSGIIVVKDAKNNTIYQFEIPVAFDTNGSKVIGSYTLTKQKEGVMVQANIPYGWFAEPSRVYPVYIDPTIDTPDGTAVFGTGIPYINISDVVIPAEQPYTVTEQIVQDNVTLEDAECEMNLLNNTDGSYTIYFRSFYNDGNGNMLFAMDGSNAWLPEVGSYTLQQYCWHGDTLNLNKIYANTTITVE